MRWKLLLLSLIVVILSPLNQAETTIVDEQGDFTLQWQLDFGEVYVSTKQITTGDTIYVRSSTSTLSKGVPSVYSLSLDGTENWRVENPNSTMSDMAPLVYVEAGSGGCGSWSNMILVGWSDGLFQALNPNNGAVIWQYNTEVVTWGITGSMLVESETVTLPTRKGLDQYCLNGDLIFTQETGIGWRNGVTYAAGAYWVGDENGKIWAVTSNNSTSYNIGQGKLRHPPVEVDNGDLLLHLQTDVGSTVYRFDTTSHSMSLVMNSGSGPGIPIQLNGYIITTDSQQITSISCDLKCSVIDSEEFRSNGEISEVFGYIVAPRNTVEGGYGQFELQSSGELTFVEMLRFSDDWYGTAGVESWTNNGQKYQLFVNDNANVKLYSTNFTVESVTEENSDWRIILVLLCALILISATSINLLRERFLAAFKYFILFTTILLYFTMADVIQAWSEIIYQEQEASNVWDDEWTEEWLGTQIVVFEFSDRTVIAGGLLDHENVLDLTEAAADQQGLTLQIIESSLGKYLVSIDDIAGEGWEYDVNGQPGTLSAEYRNIDSDSIILWRQL